MAVVGRRSQRRRWWGRERCVTSGGPAGRHGDVRWGGSGGGARPTSPALKAGQTHAAMVVVIMVVVLLTSGWWVKSSRVGLKKSMVFWCC